MPMNYLLVLSFKKYCDYYRGQRKVDFPADSDNIISLSMVSTQLAERLISIFKKDENGKRLVHDTISQYQNDSHFKELVLFYEYFNGDNCRGVGASHQTGWTGIIAELINRMPNNK
jgi:hypothetical protein